MNPADIKKVAVIGSGTMGPGIAQTFARAGREVFLVDLNEDILQRGLKDISNNLDVFVNMDIIKEHEKETILSRIHPSTDMERACRQVDYFMEVVPEIQELKQKIHRQADEWCPPHTILTSNASNMKIEKLASATRRPDRVIGTHWVNPPHIMQLVEVVKAESTSPETVETVKRFLESIGKAPVVCKDTTSYLNNYMQSALGKAAQELLEKGVATPEDIDRAVNTGFGFRLPIVGPLAFLDMAGLDNVKHNWEYLNQVSGGARGPLPKFMQDLVDKGHLGIKSGRGVYEYTRDVQTITEERNRQLILMLKALGRI